MTAATGREVICAVQMVIGAGLVRFPTDRGFTFVEVNRPDRSTRYRKGKSDPTDAEMAARAVLAGVANSTPKSGEGEIEMIRMLRSTKDSDVKASTQAVNQMKSRVVAAPARLRETLDGLTAAALAARRRSFRPGRPGDPIAAALVSRFGVGPGTAAALLISAGSNPERIHSEAAFASLCGVSPVPASSGKTNRHRLNRGATGGPMRLTDRVVLVRLCHDLRTREHMDRRTTEGMSKTEVIRCLKRYVAGEVLSALKNSARGSSVAP